MNDVENFDFDRIFDDHTIQVKKEFVDVAFILRKRAENEERLREAEQDLLLPTVYINWPESPVRRFRTWRAFD